MKDIPILFTTSNYSTLYPLSNIENNSFYTPLIGSATKYIFIDISDYQNIFNFKVNHEMIIKYYFFETNDLETIESKIPFKENGENVIIKDLSFSIVRNDNQYIGLVLEIKSSSDIFLSIDFHKKEPDKKEEEEEDNLDKIYSYNETNITLNKDKRYII